MTRFRLAHLSDLHLPMDGLPLGPRGWLSKRGLSHLSWQLKRRKRHLGSVLKSMFADIAATAPGHIAVTGDITNTARPEEFQRSIDWLSQLGAPSDVTLVPGNHDALVTVAHDDGQGHWQQWMRGDGEDPSAFPFVRLRGRIALIGVNTAIATPVFRATGKIGDAQLSRLEKILANLGAQDLFRVILMHHPVTDGLQPGRKALIDRAEMQQVLKRAGAEMILHGHTHRASLTSVAGPKGPIAVIGVPSASGTARHVEHAARWHLYDIDADGANWQVQVSARRLAPDDKFHDIADYTLKIPSSRV
ncbi:metallophosphoesterase family protein [Lacibacterium aquatile]|uniref:Metallophosphoesterase family protein n=1 Tax=Lacibacterium aquatile TaxID=1168082 RepID=A0ABW5DU55_9PROT